MTVANRSPAPTVQNLPDNRSSMSLISRSATPTTPFGGFGLRSLSELTCWTNTELIPIRFDYTMKRS